MTAYYSFFLFYITYALNASIGYFLNIHTVKSHQTYFISCYVEGTDVFAKAKTGTGKTLAFLIPGVDMLLKELHRYSKQLRAADRQQGNIRENIEKPVLLILSPTR